MGRKPPPPRQLECSVWLRPSLLWGRQCSLVGREVLPACALLDGLEAIGQAPARAAQAHPSLSGGIPGASQVAAFWPLPEPSPTPPSSAIPPRYCSRPSLPGVQVPPQPDMAAPLTFLPILCHSQARSTGQRWSLYHHRRCCSGPRLRAAAGTHSPSCGLRWELTLLHVDSGGNSFSFMWTRVGWWSPGVGQRHQLPSSLAGMATPVHATGK